MTQQEPPPRPLGTFWQEIGHGIGQLLEATGFALVIIAIAASCGKVPVPWH